MIETPQVVETPAQLIATIHIETPRSNMQHVIGPGIGAAMAAVRAQGIGPAGPWFAHHLKMAPEAFDFDICVPVSAPVRAVGRVKPGQRPAVKVVRTVYHGPYEGLGGAWHEFDAWMQANGYKTAGDLYECYVARNRASIRPIGAPNSAGRWSNRDAGAGSARMRRMGQSERTVAARVPAFPPDVVHSRRSEASRDPLANRLRGIAAPHNSKVFDGGGGTAARAAAFGQAIVRTETL